MTLLNPAAITRLSGSPRERAMLDFVTRKFSQIATAGRYSVHPSRWAPVRSARQAECILSLVTGRSRPAIVTYAVKERRPGAAPWPTGRVWRRWLVWRPVRQGPKLRNKSSL